MNNSKVIVCLFALFAFGAASGIGITKAVQPSRAAQRAWSEQAWLERRFAEDCQRLNLPQEQQDALRGQYDEITREEMPRLLEAVDVDKDGVASPQELRDYFTKNPPQRPPNADGTSATPGAPAAAAPTVRGELPADVEKRTVTIWSDGTKMAADLYLPKNRQPDANLPAVAFCSGTGGTKKGSPARLGPIFAQAGYAFLGFDYRGWGESESAIFVTGAVSQADENGEVTVKGKPIRWQMNFADQTADIRAAIAWLAGEPGIDAERIGIMGSSYGGGLVTWMAANDPRVKCVAAQVPGMGGVRGDAAQKRVFELQSKQARGETEPIPFETGKLGGKMARYEHMRVNPAKNIGFNAIEAAEKIIVPMIIIDAEKEELMDIRENGQKVADILKAKGVPVEYHVLPGITHYGIYREAFEQATKLEIAWFDKHLKREADTAVRRADAAASPADKSVRATPGPRSPEEVFAYLDTREGLRIGGDSGPAVVPGDLAKSPGIHFAAVTGAASLYLRLTPSPWK